MNAERKELSQTQTFSEYMGDFLTQIRARSVVEVGSDVQLSLAARLAPYCDRYYSVNFPEDTRRMRGWHELMEGMAGINNVELVSGNAIELSELVPHTDVVILHNVLLDLTGEDTALMWKHRRGELELSEDEWAKLVSRFDKAKEEGYREFLKVANPGYIVTFIRSDTDNNFRNFLVDRLRVDPTMLERKQLFYDDESENMWDAYIIDNT